LCPTGTPPPANDTPTNSGQTRTCCSAAVTVRRRQGRPVAWGGSCSSRHGGLSRLRPQTWPSGALVSGLVGRCLAGHRGAEHLRLGAAASAGSGGVVGSGHQTSPAPRVREPGSGLRFMQRRLDSSVRFAGPGAFSRHGGRQGGRDSGARLTGRAVHVGVVGGARGRLD